jgi:mono/diheme cytochrome c family protein
MKTKRNYLVALFLISFAFFLFPANDCNAQNTGDNWKAPAKYKSMVNKYKATKDADGVGKSLWVKHCASCHGKEGYGDGKKSGELETEMRDITSKKVQAQTDGELYYKSFIGQDEMPNFTKKIPSEEDRWLLVNYMRKLK